MNYKEVLDFWFKELGPKDHWAKSEALDKSIKQRFLKVLKAAKSGELSEWRSTIYGRLAEIIVLDQFSRNIFRNQAESFAQDAQALTLTQEALSRENHQILTTDEYSFLIMPLMHSESKKIHSDFLKYFQVQGLENTLEFELKHKAIVDEFKRYPHRNKILGRKSTPAELDFLKRPGSSF